jgi:serine/threonine protein phosphatase PrpC
MNLRVGSPQPKVKPVSVNAATGPAEQQAIDKLGNVVAQPLAEKDVDAFLKARASSTKQRGLLPSLQDLLGASPAKPTGEQALDVRAQLHAALTEITSVYADGRVTEQELTALRTAQARLDAVAGLFDPRILNLLPHAVRERLQIGLVEPVEQLRRTIGADADTVHAGIVRNLESVRANPKPEYGFVDAKVLAQHGGSIGGPDRYAPGDMVCVPRSDGSSTLGVVSSVDANGVTAEFLDTGDALSTKHVSTGSLVGANPLKIGDVVDTREGRVWVTGVGAGGVQGVIDRNDGRGAVTIDVAKLKDVAVELGQRINAFRASGAPTIVAPVSTSGARVEPQSLIVAGGMETSKPETMKGASVSGALFTWRGIGYADYNEDGAVLGVVPKGTAVAHETGFAGAFDQAGGMGHAKETGAASKIAARSFENAAQEIAHGGDPESELKAAVESAHYDVNALNVGAATTFAAAVVKNGVAHMINCGDSAVLVFDKNGKLKAQTEAHNLGDIRAKQSGDPNAGLNVANIITTCLGGDEDPRPDYSKVAVEKGDIIVCISDGVGDANLGAQKRDFKAGKPWIELNGDRTTREIGEIVKRANGDTSATSQAIIDYAKAHVESGAGKPDNVTAVVMRVG